MLLQFPSEAVHQRTQVSHGREITDLPPNLKSLEVNIADKYGKTALPLADEFRVPKTVKMLLDYGADAAITEIHDIFDQSCLEFAIKGTRNSSISRQKPV